MRTGADLFQITRENALSQRSVSTGPVWDTAWVTSSWQDFWATREAKCSAWMFACLVGSRIADRHGTALLLATELQTGGWVPSCFLRGSHPQARCDNEGPRLSRHVIVTIFLRHLVGLLVAHTTNTSAPPRPFLLSRHHHPLSFLPLSHQPQVQQRLHASTDR